MNAGDTCMHFNRAEECTTHAWPTTSPTTPTQQPTMTT
eukprot:gene29486-27723_t